MELKFKKFVFGLAFMACHFRHFFNITPVRCNNQIARGTNMDNFQELLDLSEHYQRGIKSTIQEMYKTNPSASKKYLLEYISKIQNFNTEVFHALVELRTY